ncbi:MAG: hypothetical protein CL607_06210 [Anaerolineaceae bacterium]|nr:hypothetical protein [Anaerolineaceae bacterium]
MDTVTNQLSEKILAQRLQDEIKQYVADSDVDTYRLFIDASQQLYGVILLPGDKKERPAWVVVMAEVVDGMIVIHEDTTDKPLHEALMVNVSIPRERIILAYQGEVIAT